ncbi:Uncharacterised protein [Chromobacterium violaceum]|uniref:Uncharacterized protein n=1 Tax=Chromobacterium violaceum TaxID=536 RepID=A0A3S4I8D6_CHRVL|nr:Uncharacterised protein [Chromobacterium violaceum]
MIGPAAIVQIDMEIRIPLASKPQDGPARHRRDEFESNGNRILPPVQAQADDGISLDHEIQIAKHIALALPAHEPLAVELPMIEKLIEIRVFQRDLLPLAAP